MTIAIRGRDSVAADAGQLLVRLGLVIILVGLPVAGLVSFGAIYALLPVGGGSILCGTAIAAPAHGLRRLWAALLTPLGATAVFLTAWAALSLLWTPFPALAGAKLFQMVAPAAIAVAVAASLPEKTRSFDLYLVPTGVAVAAAGALALVFFGPSSFWEGSGLDETLLERTVITLVVLVWPALGALALREHWITAAGLAVLVAFVALVDLARVALAAMGAGAFVFALAMSAPARVARALATASAGAILLAPLVPFALVLAFGAVGEVPPPISAWQETISGHWLRLVTGHGLELANIGRSLGFVPTDAPRSLLFVVWYDLGAPGAAALAFLTALAFTAAGKIASFLGPALLAGLAAVMVFAGLGVAVAQIWWLTLLACAAIACALVGEAAPRTLRPGAVEIADDGEAEAEATGSA